MYRRWDNYFIVQKSIAFIMDELLLLVALYVNYCCINKLNQIKV